MQKNHRQILLLLDNASCHKISQELTNITIHFLPPRTTSVLQPLDAGIIRSCKAKYKRMFIQNRVDAYDNAMDNDTEIDAFTLKEAIYMIADAWDCVTQETIKNCWQKTGILPITNSEENISVLAHNATETEHDTIDILFERLPYESNMTAEGMRCCVY
jgi:hypothetical protein